MGTYQKYEFSCILETASTASKIARMAALLLELHMVSVKHLTARLSDLTTVL